jgi:hypothetical protein
MPGKKLRTRPDGRATFESRYAFHLRQLTAEHFPDSEPTATEQSRLELGALISARIERLRIEMFDGVTDQTDSKLIALSKQHVAIMRELEKSAKRDDDAATDLHKHIAARTKQ